MGDQVHFVSHMISPAHSWNTYSSVNLFDAGGDGNIDTRQLANAVQLLSPHVDLFHVHNEPNWLFDAVKKHTDKPVVFDIHDWSSLRKSAPVPEFEIEQEKIALANADGFITPSKGYLQRIETLTRKPCVQVYSKVGSWLFPTPSEPKPGLTFEGGVCEGTKDVFNYPYRNWAEWAKEAAGHLEGEEKVYFYTANTNNYESYQHEKVEVSQPLAYPALLQALSQHSVGIVGSPFPVEDFEDSMPNKLFEYVASGIPVICLNSPEAKRFVEEHGLGVGVADPQEAVKAMRELSRDCDIRKRRWEYAMEAEIPKLAGFYREVMSCSSPPKAQEPASLTDQADLAATKK